jgi:uroporphyrinogen-III synthase
MLVDQLDADFIPLYRTHGRRPERLPEVDVVVLASPSAAEAFAALGRDIAAVSIGPETTKTAEECGLRVVREASTHDLDGLVEALASAPW